MRILLTAFNAFGSLDSNPSEVLLHEIKGSAGVTAVTLRTEYSAAGEELVSLIREVQPEALVCLGLADGENCLRLERTAKNWDSSPAPDNAGELRAGCVIVPGAPDAYPATLPYQIISSAWHARQIPHVLSDDAGGYVCNHAFYHACHEIAQSGRALLCGFIHVPPIAAQPSLARGLPFEMLVDAVRVCLQSISVTENDLFRPESGV